MIHLLLTSPEGYARRLMKALADSPGTDRFRGVSRPMIQTDIHITSPDFRAFMHHLADFDYVAFSSRKAIEAFATALHEEQLTLPEGLQLCAIGKDNEMLREALHVEPAFVAEEPSPMGIVRHLETLSSAGLRIAVLAPEVIGMEEPPIVPDFVRGLAGIGMQPVRINAYRTQAASAEVLQDTARQIQQGAYDAVVFTSGTEIKVFLQMLPQGMDLSDFMQHLTVICYGPYTARCAAQYGLPVDFTSPAFGSFEELVGQIAKYYSAH